MCETRVERLLRACSACIASLGRNTNILQICEIFIRPAHASDMRYCMTAKANKRKKVIFIVSLIVTHTRQFHGDNFTLITRIIIISNALLNLFEARQCTLHARSDFMRYRFGSMSQGCVRRALNVCCAHVARA